MYYPDAQNSPGHQVMTKADSEPGCMDPNFLSEHNERGFVHVPGVPNGTENDVEMGQLFGDFKSNVYANMHKVWMKKCKVEGPHATISDKNILCCAFGIDFYFKDGSVMELVNPQSVSFS
jgi:hypothetical protein